MKLNTLTILVAASLLAAGTAFAQNGPGPRGKGFGGPPQSEGGRGLHGKGPGNGMGRGQDMGKGYRRGPRDGTGPQAGTTNCPAMNPAQR